MGPPEEDGRLPPGAPWFPLGAGQIGGLLLEEARSQIRRTRTASNCRSVTSSNWMGHIGLIRVIKLLGILLLFTGSFWRRTLAEREVLRPTMQRIVPAQMDESASVSATAEETVDPRTRPVTSSTATSSSPDCVLLSPSTMVVVRGGLRHFFWRWSEVLAFVRPKETTYVFATQHEIADFWEHVKYLEDCGLTAPEGMMVHTCEQWTLDQVYVRVDEQLPDVQDSVRDILSLLRPRSYLETRFYFNLDERDPDRY